MTHPEVVRKYLATEVAQGRKAGPFLQPPFDTLVGSPMGVIEKKRSNPVKFRIIHDLSWPAGASVNDHIDPEKFRCFYASFDDAVNLVKRRGVGALMAKLDLTDAFKHILVRPEDWPLLCSTWEQRQPDGTVVTEFYVDLFLPFGLRSSPRLFNDYADALEFAMRMEKVKDLLHYLDDYFTVGPPGTDECRTNMDTMVRVCKDLGFTVNPDKVTDPATTTTFLGIDIDSVKQEARIDPVRLKEITRELRLFKRARSATKRQILSIVGKLHFICRVCPPGRAFLRRMIDISQKARHLHHRIKLNAEFRADINWWLDYLPDWNGVSILHDADWTDSPDLELFTDASDQGYGCYLQGHWCQGTFPDMGFKDQQMSINWRELYAATMALALWGHKFRGKRVLLHCDNESVVHIMAKASSKSKTMMKLA